MRKLLTSIFLMLAISTLAQVPQGFNYQAVIRNSSGELITEQDVSVRISILQGSTTGSPVYTETHSVQTNTFGLINLVIGQGESSDDFSTVDWSNNPYYLKIELDVTGSTDYVYCGTSQLLSVPYAMYAEETGIQNWHSGENHYFNFGYLLGWANYGFDETTYLNHS